MMQDSLHKKYYDFPGGYFDKGGVHWLLRDGLGSVGMTVDDSGQVEQHVQYYPYGEPHREPQGQPYLYGGKERRRFGGLNDYDFHARFLNPAAALWHAPDPHASLSPWISPYVFCAANPIRRVDPTGMTDRKKENKDLIDASAYEESLEEQQVEAPKQSNATSEQDDSKSDEDKELTALEKANIAVNGGSSAMGVQDNLITGAAKTATGINKSGAALKAFSPELSKLVKFGKLLGVAGVIITGANSMYTWNIYSKSGGNHSGVKFKLATDFIMSGVSMAGWGGLGAGIIYTVLDFTTGGFGTDKIIEEQINY